MAQKKQNKSRFNVATAIGPTQIVVVDFTFASGLTTALIQYENGNTGYAYEFLSRLHDSLVNQDQGDQESHAVPAYDKE